MSETFGYEPKTPGIQDLEKFDKYAEHESDTGTIIESPMKDDVLKDVTNASGFKSYGSSGKNLT